MSKPLKLPTILVISANPGVRNWIKKQTEDDFFIIFADTESQARGALNSRLDLIILDSNTEEYDPLALCKEITLLLKTYITPIFLITGKLKKSYRDQAKSSGVTEFLSDPLDLEEFKTRIAEATKNASAREKTADLSASIKPPAHTPSPSLKDKLVLNDEGLRVLAEAKNNNTPTALLVLRIDQFHHLAAPQTVFQQLAAFLKTLLRPQDALIPYSDGKFICILANSPPQAARKIAERLKEKIERQPFAQTHHVTLSIAIAAPDLTEKSIHQMLDSAIKSFKARSETNLIISLDPETP